ncbi:Uncharacterised protein [Shigella flexneri]|nr:Uncharacterised protein [Shigella flexneri]
MIGHSGDLFLLSFVVLPPPGTAQADNHKQHQPGEGHQPAVAFFAAFTEGKTLHWRNFCSPKWSLLFQPWQQFFFWNMYQTRIRADISAQEC